MASQMDKEGSSYTLEMKSLGSSSPSQRRFLSAQVTLRVLAIAATVPAISLMVASAQSVMMFGFTFEAHYSYSSALKFLLGADIMVCTFSALSLIFVYLMNRSRSNLTNYFYLFYMIWQVMMVLMISGCAAVTGVGYIGRFGEEKIGWGAVSDRVVKFCSRMMVSVALSYSAFIAYLALTIISATKLMSQVKSPEEL